MTREEAIDQLNQIVANQGVRKEPDGYVDCEWDHRNADDILLDLINDEEVSVVYNKIAKWYA